MKTLVVNCSTRKAGFSALMSDAVASQFGGEVITYFLNEALEASILETLGQVNLLVISSPIFSSDLVPSFYKFIDSISSRPAIPCVLVISCGNSGFLCSSSVRSALKRLRRAGFHPVFDVVLDHTFMLSPNEIPPKSRTKISKLCERVFRSIPDCDRS